MTGPTPLPHRADRRTTALGVLAIFLPLFGALLWWGFSNRYAPGGLRDVAEGALTAGMVVVASAFAAGGPALLAALLLANHARLGAVFHPRLGKILTALGLALFTPFAVFDWLPWVTGPHVVILLMVSGEDIGRVDPDALAMFPKALAMFAVLAGGWYLPAALLISGIRGKALRFAGFALVWWAIYGGILLVTGYQRFTIP